MATTKTVSKKQRSKVRSAEKATLKEIKRILQNTETTSVMIDPESDKSIRGQMDNDNARIVQVFLNSAKKIEIVTEGAGVEGGGLLDGGDYSTDDIITVLEVLEEAISTKH